LRRRAESAPPERTAWIALAALALGVLGFAAPGVGARPGDEQDAAAALAATFVLNFVRYTEWPDTSFEDDTSPIAILVLGSPGVASALAALAERAGPIGGRRLVVRAAPQELLETPGWSRLPAEVSRAQVVFVGGGVGPGDTAELLAALAGADVLTVGEVANFAENGGMLGLVARETRFVFHANARAIRASRLRISPRLLKLARVVSDATP
jgi:hypothetical protein